MYFEHIIYEVLFFSIFIGKVFWPGSSQEKSFICFNKLQHCFFVVPTEYIQDIYKRFTNAFSALICELMDAENITASEASKKAKDLLSK